MTRLSYSTYLCLLHSTSVKFSNSTEKMLLYDRFFDNAYAFTHRLRTSCHLCGIRISIIHDDDKREQSLHILDNIACKCKIKSTISLHQWVVVKLGEYRQKRWLF